jgi:hypothetical protein
MHTSEAGYLDVAQARIWSEGDKSMLRFAEKAKIK